MALPKGVSHLLACQAVIGGVRLLAGHQVVSFTKAWNVCTGREADALDSENAKQLQWLLEELGYEQQWVSPLGRTNMLHVWVRGPWPIDFQANLHRQFDAFVSMS